MLEVLCAPTLPDSPGLLECPIRADVVGDGRYGAPRSGRKHNGIDLAAPAGSILLSPVCGTVTKLGYPYGDDLSFRYVEVTRKKLRVRFFYVEPRSTLKEGDEVRVGTRLGRVQTLQNRYRGVIDHIHLEVKDKEGRYVDPSARDLSW